MKKIFLLRGLDCPHCSAVIEKEVGELEGVSSSVVNLVNQTLTVEAEPSCAATLNAIVEEIVHSHEPEVQVSEYLSKNKAEKEHKKTEDRDEVKNTVLRLSLGAVLLVLAVILGALTEASPHITAAVYIAAYVILGGDIVLKAVNNIAKGRVFDENFLMSLSTLGAFAIGEYPEAVAVMLFYQIGEFFQETSVRRSRRSIASLMDVRPDSASVKRDGKLVTLSPESVLVGDIIVIRPGERIPLDGIVTDGESMLDTKALTGESVPKTARVDDEVLSGCINQNGVLTVRVTKAYGESTVAKIIDLVQNASSRKAPTEKFITAFARYYTPAVVILAAILAFVPPIILGGGYGEWLRRGMVFLVISCPCALVVSIPLAFFGGIGAASRHGVLVKGSNYLEALNKIDTVVFDKTGTLTKGVFKVTAVIPSNGFTEEQLLEYAAAAEVYSNHPIAESILTAYGKNIDRTAIKNYVERIGYGVSAVFEDKKVAAGNARLMEAENIPYTECDKAGTKVYVALDGRYAGCILITDELKKDCKKAIGDLGRLGVRKTVMLTGDNEVIAKATAEELGLDEYYAELLPHQKFEKLEALEGKRKTNGKIAFVGDGINDAPVLARADVGIAMGGLGSDAAIEAADVVLMTDEISSLGEAINIAKATKRIVIQNIIISLAIKGAFLILGAVGIAGMWEAVFGDVGVALIAVFNAMRIMKK